MLIGRLVALGLATASPVVVAATPNEPDGPAIEDPPARRHLDGPPRLPPPRTLADPSLQRGREVGTPTTLFVNFDGVTISQCDRSNSHEDCHWYNVGAEIPPFSGTIQTQVSVLQAMRRAADDFGIRITGVRPPDDEDYTMVVYGGLEADFGVLGSAPSGDCFDQSPNQIAFAHVDGELNTWVNGGATTALHEAAHSWGLSHIDVDTGIMYPTASNMPTGYRRDCDQVVMGVDLAPSDLEGVCTDINESICGAPDQQNAGAVLSMLFGPAYVDTTPPTITLVEPEDGQYFQAPATFDVVLDIEDDLHPQQYDMRIWLGDDGPPEMPSPTVAPGFALEGLPIGSWDVHLELVDKAGNASRLDFSVEVGEDPPPDPSEDGDGCACRTRPTGVSTALWIVVLGTGLARRRRRR